MANVERYRYGKKDLILVPVDETTVVEIGDFICRAISTDYDADNTVTLNYGCTPAQLVTAGNAATEMGAAADQLLGIAVSASLNGQTDDILVATKGFFELTQKAAAAIHVGDSVAIYSNATNCEDQTVVENSDSQIAVCVKHKASITLTGVLCKLLPSLLLGTPQG